MKPFLKSVAEFIYSNFPEELRSLVVIFPNKRARIFFNKYLSEIAEKPIFSPQYYTISEYMQELSGSLIADQLTLLFELYEVYTSVRQTNESFDDFLFYCEMLLADFDDIDKYLVNAEMLFTNLADLKDIDKYFDYLDELQLQAIRQFWETFNSSKDSDEKIKFGNLWKVLFRIYAEFNRRLDEKGICYEGKAYKKSILELEQKEISGSKVAFVGFNALNLCERKLFERMQKLGKGLYFWDYDEYYIRKLDSHEAGFFLKRLTKQFPLPLGFSFDSYVEDPDKKINILNIPSVTGQAKALSQAIGLLPENWKEKPVNTAIALAEEGLLLPVLNSMPSTVEEVNISMGYPIKETQVYSLTGILLDLLRNKRIHKDGTESFYHSDVTRLLKHALLNSGYAAENDDLILEINRSNLVFINNRKLENLDALPQNVFKSGITTINFIAYLIEILEQLPGFYVENATESQIVEHEAAFRIITQLRRIDDILSQTQVNYSYKSLLRLVGKVLQGTTVPFTGEPLSGLQVMGILETRTLDFENLIVLSMNEGIFPKSGNVPSFIPYTLRKGFELPTIEHQDAIFGYYFYRLFHRAQNIVLIYSSSVQDMKSGEPSRFIQQLKYEKAFNPVEQTLSYKIFPLQKRKVEVHRTKEALNILMERYLAKGNRVLSPSAINTYLNCQLRFYFNYVAGIPEPDTIIEEVEANVFGSILHKTIERLYHSLGDGLVTVQKLEELNNKKVYIQNELVRAFGEEYLSPGKEFPDVSEIEIAGKNILVKEVIQKYIHNIIGYDMKIAPFRIIDLEKKLSTTFELDSGVKINVGGIIDRLDQKEGYIRIIDYKTGKLKNNFPSVNELFYDEALKRNDAAFQLFLYSILISHEFPDANIVPGLYFVREITTESYDWRLKTGERNHIQQINSIAPFLQEFRELLQETLNRIFSPEGVFEQTKDEKYCSFCPYKGICGKI
jgi:RecB family exonuclease